LASASWPARDERGGFHWIADLLREFGHMGPVPSNAIMGLLAAYQGLPLAFATGFSAMIATRRRLPWSVVFPFVFTAAEYLSRSSSPGTSRTASSASPP